MNYNKVFTGILCTTCNIQYPSVCMKICQECNQYFCLHCENLRYESIPNPWICYLCHELKLNKLELYIYLPKICQIEIFQILLCFNRLKLRYKEIILPKFIRYEIIKFIILTYNVETIPSYIEKFKVKRSIEFNTYCYYKDKPIFYFLSSILKDFFYIRDNSDKIVIIGVRQYNTNRSSRKLNQREELLINKLGYKYDKTYI